MPFPSKVLITGASGNLGNKLVAHLRQKTQLVLLDRIATDDEVLQADLSVWEQHWVRQFEGVQVVYHLAGNPIAVSSWSELIGPNVDAMLHVFEAAAQHRVRRLIFASSNHVMGGYQHEREVRLTSTIEPKPGLDYGDGRSSMPYAATKLFGERVGKHFADARGLQVIAVRLGWVWRGDNTPQGLPTDRSPWFREMWLSDRDFVHLMECCATATLADRFLVINGMSNNQGMRWDLSEACRLGYTPQDDVKASC